MIATYTLTEEEMEAVRALVRAHRKMATIARALSVRAGFDRDHPVILDMQYRLKILEQDDVASEPAVVKAVEAFTGRQRI